MTGRETVIYRPYEDRDAEGVMAIINDAFHIHRYTRRRYLERSALESYLDECLQASSYAQVAVLEGKVVGVIMGCVQGEPFLPGRVRRRTRILANSAWLLTVGLPQRHTLRYFFAFERYYRTLREDARQAGPWTLSDEVTLLAVHAAARGRGVGTGLYQGFMSHLREHGRSELCLYTDGLCTYQFYERAGLVRAAERSLELNVPGLPGTVGVYLYAGRVPQAGSADSA